MKKILKKVLIFINDLGTNIQKGKENLNKNEINNDILKNNEVIKKN